MNEKNIVLNSVEAAKEFVKAASECDFDIEVGHNYVDAKSLLGLYSLSLQRPMMLHIQADGDILDEIVAELQEFTYMDVAYEC